MNGSRSVNAMSGSGPSLTSQKETRNKLKAKKAGVRQRDSSSSESDCIGLMVNHMMSASSSSRTKDWIVDSGATCHMCNAAC